MTLDEAIEQYEEQAKDFEKANLPSCAKDTEQVVEWLKHYKAIRQVVHEWNCDYYAIKSKSDYFEEILETYIE